MILALALIAVLVLGLAMLVYWLAQLWIGTQSYFAVSALPILPVSLPIAVLTFLCVLLLVAVLWSRQSILPSAGSGLGLTSPARAHPEP